MKPLMVWAIAPAVVACSALLAAYNVTREVDPTTYLTLSANWPSLDPVTRHDLAAMVEDGKLSRWEWARGFRLIMDRRGILLGHSYGMTLDSNPAKARSIFLTLSQDDIKESGEARKSENSDD